MIISRRLTSRIRLVIVRSRIIIIIIRTIVAVIVLVARFLRRILILLLNTIVMVMRILEIVTTIITLIIVIVVDNSVFRLEIQALPLGKFGISEFRILALAVTAGEGCRLGLCARNTRHIELRM